MFSVVSVVFSTVTDTSLTGGGDSRMQLGVPMRAAVIALTAIALLAAPAYARGKGKQQSPGQSEEQKKKAADAEKAYKSALDRIPNQPKTDPWGGMR
jgi:hypothetical protein